MSRPVLDVAVVGAGPAGATAAARLASYGFDVALIDRSIFPRAKPCGGGLSPKAYRLLDVDVRDLVLARHRVVNLRAPRFGAVSLESHGGSIWMIQRAAFDRRLVEHAVARGAALAENVTVRQVEVAADGREARLETDRGVILARAVIGADGSDSVVARAIGLRLNRERRYMLAIEADGQRPVSTASDVAVIDFALHGGYAWYFPKGEVCNVGVGTSDRRLFPRLRGYLAGFLERHQLAFVDEPRVVGHKIPVWHGAEPLHHANVVLAGDAAGVADPFFGEGIAYAIQTGRYAADAVACYLPGAWPDLAGYTTAVQSMLARDLRFWSTLGKLVYRAPSVAVALLSSNRIFQRLADQAISGDKSFSKTWKR